MNQAVSCSVLSSEKLTLQLGINQWLQYATAHMVKECSKLQYTFPQLVLEAKFKRFCRILLRHWSHRTDNIPYVHIRLRQVLNEHYPVPHFSIPSIFLLIQFFHLFRVVQISASRRQKSIPEAGSHELRSVNRYDVHRSTRGKYTSVSYF